MAKPLQHYVARSGDRDEAIALAYDSGGYGMKEIGEHVELHYSRVSRIVSGSARQKVTPWGAWGGPCGVDPVTGCRDRDRDQA